jgi:hypothetical protein
MKWISVNEKLPEPLETVWITNGKFVNLGCLVDHEDGWCWAKSVEEPYIQDGKILVGCEPDDLDVTHWHPVPSMEMFNRRKAQTQTQ